jgi:hypothetical protein
VQLLHGIYARLVSPALIYKKVWHFSLSWSRVTVCTSRRAELRLHEALHIEEVHLRPRWHLEAAQLDLASIRHKSAGKNVSGLGGSGSRGYLVGRWRTRRESATAAARRRRVRGFNVSVVTQGICFTSAPAPKFQNYITNSPYRPASPIGAPFFAQCDVFFFIQEAQSA